MTVFACLLHFQTYSPPLITATTFFWSNSSTISQDQILIPVTPFLRPPQFFGEVEEKEEVEGNPSLAS